MRMKGPMPEPTHQLPPLILHPFTDAATSIEVLETAKEAAQQMLPSGGHYTESDELRERLVAGRYAELRMLFFVGKDVTRWINQCLDFGQRTECLKGR